MKLLATAILTLSSIAAFSQTSDKLDMGGKVNQVLKISVDAEAVASDLDLHTDQTDLLVAKVTHVSNAKNGYKVILESQNKSLQHEDGAKVGKVDYTMKFGNVTYNPRKKKTIKYKANQKGIHVNDVKISYNGTPEEEMAAGRYNDIINFTIQAN